MMKIYFVRHGEGLDDVYNEYGGWSDRELSPKGIQLAFKISEKLKDLAGKFDIVLTSPLKRSVQTANVIGEVLSLRVIDEPYLKERNTYGLLSGVNIDIAKEEYFDLVAKFNRGKYIPAAERYEDFVHRVRLLVDYLKTLKYENIICVTHGHLITVMVEEFLGLVRDRIENGCILGIEITNDQIKLIHQSGLTFCDSADLSLERQRMKFKED